MKGMSATTGLGLAGVAHLRQSITDILGTPLGSRVMRSNYGSRLFELLDQPAGPQTTVAVHAAVAEALQQQEPRLELHQVQHRVYADGRFELTLMGEYRPAGRPITLEGLIL